MQYYFDMLTSAVYSTTLNTHFTAVELADFVMIGAFPILPRLLSSLAWSRCACVAEPGLCYYSDP